MIVILEIYETETPVDLIINDTSPNISIEIFEQATVYLNGSPPSNITALDNLTDVEIDAPVNGQALVFNQITGLWENATVAGSGDMLAASNLNDVQDKPTARINLGLEIGVNIQAFSTILQNTTESFTNALKTAYDSSVTWISTNGSNLINHLTNTVNPHNVTKAQVGLGSVPDVDLSGDVAINNAKVSFDNTSSTKLAGIESGATSDQTNSEIVIAVNAELGNTDWQTQKTLEQIQDIIGEMFQSGTQTNITVDYDDVAGTLNLTGSVGGGATLTDEQVQDIVGAFSTSGTGISVNYDDAGNIITFSLTGESFTTAYKNKLDGIAAGATVNDTDANLRARASHTGTQIASTISDFASAVSANTDVAANTAKISFDNTSSTRLANTSGPNTGDNAVNSNYSGLASSKQDTLVSGTNIRPLNGNSLLGSAPLVLKEENFIGSALINLAATGTVAALDFNIHVHGYYNLTGAMTLPVTAPTLAVGDTVSRTIEIKANGFATTLPTSITDSMVGTYDSAKRNFLAITYVQIDVSTLIRFANLSVK